ncbi:hypothetical protein [Caballeronia sp. INDeC2]|uniref:hypothetical protein n=1 Tax=Caballeronia sp. INDeC2 TaxID=2921747 RepID=UPI0020291F1E|nr:hypothetical protein [Caballeronia sp. INDeC2]
MGAVALARRHPRHVGGADPLAEACDALRAERLACNQIVLNVNDPAAVETAFDD